MSKRAPHSWTDGGWKSRKLWFGFYATALLFAGMYCGGKIETMQPMYGEFVGGLVAIVTIVLGGNIASKWVAGDAIKKTGGEVLAAQPPPKPSPPAPKASPPAPRGSAAD